MPSCFLEARNFDVLFLVLFFEDGKPARRVIVSEAKANHTYQTCG